MGRLTKLNEDACEFCKGWDYCMEEDPCFLYEVYEKLSDYEDLEEQGRLIELPCAVGDTVWYIDKSNKIKESIINRISIGNRFCWFTLSNGKEIGYSDKFGGITDQYFLTKEEAEAKLKELEGDKE